MIESHRDRPIEIFSTCPQSTDYARADYIEQVRKVSQWSEAYSYKGILVYADNRLVDPWMVSQVIIESTNHLCPLVAVQPVYMHPYTVANMVASFGHMYGRRLYLNMVAGGFKKDLEALNDQTPHDQRYRRLSEYTRIIQELLEGEKPVSFDGEFYTVNGLSLKPELPEELMPGIFLSGSSEAGLNAAIELGATAIKYPEPTGKYDEPEDEVINAGIRIGIIARKESQAAWKAGYERFPADREGQLAHELAMKTSDSKWHEKLSRMGEQVRDKPSPYWLHPFENYKTFCPYLVGSYEEVADEISKYVGHGFRTFILDIPPNKEELHHTNRVFEKALEVAAL